MEDPSLATLSIPENVILQLSNTSKTSSTLKQCLESLWRSTLTPDGRSKLASKNILPVLLELCEHLPYPTACSLLLSSLKLLRELCSPLFKFHNLFVEKNGIQVVCSVLKSILDCDHNVRVIGYGLQVLGNVCEADKQHEEAILGQLYPDMFFAIAKVKSTDTLAPLCKMIYHSCFDEGPEWSIFNTLYGDNGISLMTEIIKSYSSLGFGDYHFIDLNTMICLWEKFFPTIFPKLGVSNHDGDNGEETELADHLFTAKQASFLGIICRDLTLKLRWTCFSREFALYVLDIIRRILPVIDSRIKSASVFPTGCIVVDVLGYSIKILGYITLQISMEEEMSLQTPDNSEAVNALLASGLVELFISLIRELELPAKPMRQGSENQEGITSSSSLKPCLYKGYRRDLVAVIANSAWKKKHVQDEIRERNGILPVLQHCFYSDNAPIMKRWGIWFLTNICSSHEENQQVVYELEIRGYIDLPIYERYLREDYFSD